MDKISIEKVTKVFGPRPERALALLGEGKSKREIMDETRHAVGLVDVSFAVNEGETLVVMGLSGSGKSTLIRCLNGLIKPTSGRVLVDGADVTRMPEKALVAFRRRKFGMVFQNFALFPHRSVIRNVEYGLEVQGVDPSTRTAKAREALELVGLGGWEDSMPSQLSGGMQQRVGLARALAVDPDVLLMDEAFSALDPLIRRDMQHELISLQDRVQKTIVFITHDLDEAIKIGDRVVLMKDGAVVQIGTAEEILTNPAGRYVERFVEEVDVTKVLTARTVMIPTRAVAYAADGPRTALHKMKEAGISNIFVVKKDDSLLGIVSAAEAKSAIDRGEKNISSIIEEVRDKVGPDEPVSALIPIVAASGLPVAVVDGKDKLLGVVIKGSLLSCLAEGGSG